MRKNEEFRESQVVCAHDPYFEMSIDTHVTGMQKSTFRTKENGCMLKIVCTKDTGVMRPKGI